MFSAAVFGSFLVFIFFIILFLYVYEIFKVNKEIKNIEAKIRQKEIALYYILHSNGEIRELYRNSNSEKAQGI